MPPKMGSLRAALQLPPAGSGPEGKARPARAGGVCPSVGAVVSSLGGHRSAVFTPPLRPRRRHGEASQRPPRARAEHPGIQHSRRTRARVLATRAVHDVMVCDLSRRPDLSCAGANGGSKGDHAGRLRVTARARVWDGGGCSSLRCEVVVAFLVVQWSPGLLCANEHRWHPESRDGCR